MAPGQNHRVELRDDANGLLEADAMRFVAKAEKSATWALAATQTGDHRVYAKWPASAANATNAVFAVTHGGGTTNVTVNQRVNGGQWVLLGTFPFTAGGQGYKVVLSDAAAGRVAADAVHLVPEPVVTDAFTWTPAIPAPGDYQLYARWTASSVSLGTLHPSACATGSMGPDQRLSVFLRRRHKSTVSTSGNINRFLASAGILFV